MDESSTEQLPTKAKDAFTKKRMFDQQDSLRLIECVRARPKLWHRQYLRTRATGITDWEDIQRKEFHTISVNQLRVRWKTLRDCFRREAKRIEDGNVRGNHWPLYQHMEFLHGHFRLKRTTKRRNGGTVGERKNRFPHLLKIESDTIDKAKLHLKPTLQGDIDTVNEIDQNDVEEVDETCSEVTYKNKFRSPRKSTSSEENNEDSGSNLDAGNPNCHFLMSLTPFLNELPAQENLKVRIKMLQLVAAASKLCIGSKKEPKD